MTPFEACEDIVRRHDPDRYFSALFAPERERGHLFVLYAFYYETVHALRAAKEPMLAEIRLAWWREAVETARAGRPRDHAVAKALAVTLGECDLPDDLFQRLIEGRRMELTPLETAQAAEDWADATVGSLLRLSLQVLGEEAGEAVRPAAIAYALAGRQIAGSDAAGLSRQAFDAFRRGGVSRQAVPAFLPLALVPLYWKTPNPPLWRKLIALYVASLRGKI